VIEGLAGGGKTSLAEFIKDAFDYIKIDEAIHTNIDGSDKDAYLKQDLDKHRLFHAHKNSVMDRSYLSTLAFNYASDHVFHTDAFPYISEKVNRYLASGALSIPERVIFIEVPIETSLRRQKKSNAAYWSDTSMLTFTDKFNKHYIDSLDPRTVLRIDGTQSFETVCAIVSDKMKHPESWSL
jgi:thymidylate kinase